MYIIYIHTYIYIYIYIYTYIRTLNPQSRYAFRKCQLYYMYVYQYSSYNLQLQYIAM